MNQKKNCYALLDFVNNRIPPSIRSTQKPLVSIIVINRNGIKHLNILIPALIKQTRTISFEFIFVDNASEDNSIEFVKSKFLELAPKISVNIIKNKKNESFSAANNKAVTVAKGKYIVLLNNDIEPLHGWLNFMLETANNLINLGSIGARLVYPSQKISLIRNPLRRYHKNSCLIQHSGISFKNEGKQFRPYNLGKGRSFFDSEVLKYKESCALTAACLLIPRKVYLEVGGLDETFNYGGEDVDFGLRLKMAGYQNMYCPDAVLFHYEFGTQNKEKQVVAAHRREKNLLYFQEKWFLTIKKLYWKEKIEGKIGLYSESPLLVGLHKTDNKLARKLCIKFENYGWKIKILKKRFKVKPSKIQSKCDLLLTEDKNGNFYLKNKFFNDKVDIENINSIKEGLSKLYLNPSIVIKIAAKTWKRAYSWSDYHTAISLKNTLEQGGHHVLLQIYPEWENDEGMEYDAVIVLRGGRRYKVKPHQINIIWNISHPENIKLEEYQEYDKVFIASEYWHKKIHKQILTSVETLLQCTDLSQFRPARKKQKIDQ